MSLNRNASIELSTLIDTSGTRPNRMWDLEAHLYIYIYNIHICGCGTLKPIFVGCICGTDLSLDVVFICVLTMNAASTSKHMVQDWYRGVCRVELNHTEKSCDRGNLARTNAFSVWLVERNCHFRGLLETQLEPCNTGT